MRKTLVINHTDKYAITSDDGAELFDVIYAALSQKRKVRLVFSHLRVLAPPFLNAAIGKLYSKLDPEVVDNYLSITGLTFAQRMTLLGVKQSAMRYYHDADYARIVDDVLSSMRKEMPE